MPLKIKEATSNRDSMAKTIYSRIFSILIEHINQQTNPGGTVERFIGVLDIFGFENFKCNRYVVMVLRHSCFG